MKTFNVKEYKTWIETNKTLEEIGDFLVNEKVCREFDYDYENVYEWLETDVNEAGVKFNLSRKHRNGKGIEKEPIHILVMYSGKEPENTLVDKLAKLISSHIGKTANLGKIIYLGNDSFEYKPTQTVSS